jgi:protein-S-isoprenylcysteine O-methyltransferase Ste14
VTLVFAIPMMFALIYMMTILDEERALREAHGNAYEDYVSAVPRFIPR